MALISGGGGSIPDPVVTAITVTPPAGAAGVAVTPVSPNATGTETDALKITVPQSTAPNFPNIYALVVFDPNTGQTPLRVGSDGSVGIYAQPFAIPLRVAAASTNPDGRLAGFFDHASNVVVDIDESGGVHMPLLPTADPHVVGALWNSAGSMKISAG